ncbi:hypothetical protein LIER_33787 [Lithospermum erythrorhizon]|uniref:Uncharacterized protein n=1 Tax=Lithospermum erythrorhizon TaxID=34254 RepID=A0AAV3S1E1_LITER
MKTSGMEPLGKRAKIKWLYRSTSPAIIVTAVSPTVDNKDVQTVADIPHRLGLKRKRLDLTHLNLDLDLKPRLKRGNPRQEGTNVCSNGARQIS